MDSGLIGQRGPPVASTVNITVAECAIIPHLKVVAVIAMAMT